MTAKTNTPEAELTPEHSTSFAACPDCWEEHKAQAVYLKESGKCFCETHGEMTVAEFNRKWENIV